MVGRRTLDPSIMVRIHVPQHIFMSYSVYILRTSSNTLYIGQTNNLEKRLKEHQSKTGRSAKYIKYFDSCKLVYSEEHSTRIEAMRREYKLKHWTKAQKEVLISGNSENDRRLIKVNSNIT